MRSCSIPSVTYVRRLLKYINEINYGTLATVVGRYYAMDRDKRYERIQIAYEGLVKGIGQPASPETVVEVITVIIEAHITLNSFLTHETRL